MKRTLRKPICIILSVMMLLTALPFTVYATETVTKEVSTAEGLTAACNEINTNGGEYTISLSADISGGIDISKSNAVVTVVGNGHTLTSAGTAVAVSNGATVNLGDGNSVLTLKGSENGDTPGIVYVLEDSFCNMKANVTLKDHKGSNYFGGGVTVQGGTFHMYGGTIQNCGIDGGSVCYGGGVAVFADGTFVMDGGTITNCYVKSNYIDDRDPNRCLTAAGGGVFVTAGSTFIMNGGTISNNTAENSEGMAFGGGVAMVISDSYSNYSEAKNYGMGNPRTWYADYSNVNTSEVRFVRKSPVNYHINNSTIADAKYDRNDIFTSYVEKAAGKLITAGDTINAFYAIPEITPTAENSCPYIFKGWYYDRDNEDDDDPVKFGTDKYNVGKDIYAHWIEVKNVEKDSADIYSLPENETAYGGFDLAGVQVREPVRDTNFDSVLKPGGMRFMTSLSMDVVNQINAIQTNNIEYGYVTATDEGWIGYHEHFNHKLQYVSATANGIDTSSDKALDENYFGFANNIVCTSKKINSSVELKEDHRNYSGYLLYTLVITYEDCDSSAYNKNVLARPYIRYTDANGLERVAYSEYRGTNKLGGCYTNYNAVAKQ